MRQQIQLENFLVGLTAIINKFLMKISKKIKNFSKWALVIIVIAFFIFFPKIENNFLKNRVNNINYVKIANQIIKVELAISQEDQIQGLSRRISLKDDEGMLFIFQKSGLNYFWMKEMNFPIDIIWINENFQVIFIQEDVQPESFPEIFGPDEKSKYVLEIIAGFVRKNNLSVGDPIEFLP